MSYRQAATTEQTTDRRLRSTEVGRKEFFRDDYFDLLCIASTILLVGGFAAIKYIG
jgi:hypothetical protein